MIEPLGADPPPRAKLSVDGVHKRFGSVVALQATSLEMRQGEFLTLLGPSGSGKTTLLMMVAGLTQPDGGSIRIDGRLATYDPPFQRDIGMVFQSYALFPHLSVYDNIAFPLRMRRRPGGEIARDVERVLELVQLPHVANRFPRQLSGGQQQRIALARCIVYRPSIILMDEPLGALDKKLRDQLQLEIKRLHRQLGTTILYVTHDQQETLTMSDRVCLMNHGRIEQIGTPHDLYFRPRSVFAADFLGESNIFPATIVGTDADQLMLRSPAFGEALVRAPRRDGIAGAVRIMVRPERMVLAEQTAPGWNSVPATVTDIIFGGGTTRVHARLADGATIFLTGLTADDVGPIEPDSAVRLSWRAESTVVLPEPSVVQ
jgi:putative spermidine/putrescine transport system ATP-binding protein